MDREGAGGGCYVGWIFAPTLLFCVGIVQLVKSFFNSSGNNTDQSCCYQRRLSCSPLLVLVLRIVFMLYAATTVFVFEPILFLLLIFFR